MLLDRVQRHCLGVAEGPGKGAECAWNTQLMDTPKAPAPRPLAVFIRSDRGWGTEGNMQRAEQEGLPYLFKLRITAGVKRSVERLMR